MFTIADMYHFYLPVLVHRPWYWFCLSLWCSGYFFLFPFELFHPWFTCNGQERCGSSAVLTWKLQDCLCSMFGFDTFCWCLRHGTGQHRQKKNIQRNYIFCYSEAFNKLFSAEPRHARVAKDSGRRNQVGPTDLYELTGLYWLICKKNTSRPPITKCVASGQIPCISVPHSQINSNAPLLNIQTQI